MLSESHLQEPLRHIMPDQMSKPREMFFVLNPIVSAQNSIYSQSLLTLQTVRHPCPDFDMLSKLYACFAEECLLTTSSESLNGGICMDCCNMLLGSCYVLLLIQARVAAILFVTRIEVDSGMETQACCFCQFACPLKEVNNR